MSQPSISSYGKSVTVEVSAGALYDLVFDITRTGGIAMFEEKFGEQAQAEITDRTEQALDGIPRTLAAIKRIAESTGSAEEAES